MLFLLTGDIQCGKTRWLEKLCREIEAKGTCVAGILAPGVWEESHDTPEKFFKLGIDNILLPSKKKIRFANRPNQKLVDKDRLQAFVISETIQKTKLIDITNLDSHQSVKPEICREVSCKNAEKYRVGWDILDDAVSQVNNHFFDLIALNENAEETVQAKEISVPNLVKTCPKNEKAQNNTNEKMQIEKNSLLVVDELGRLELAFNCGLTNTVKLLESGPSSTFPNAIAVVRKTLLDLATIKFSGAWDEIKVIEPNNSSRELVLNSIYS